MANKKNKASNNDVKLRSKLDSAKIQEMLAILLRNEDAFSSVADALDFKHVDYHNGGLALVWRLTKQFHKKQNKLPPLGVLNAELHQKLEANPEIVEPDDVQLIDEFLEYAYDDKQHGKKLSKSKIHVQVAVETAKQLIEEYTAVQLRRELEEIGDRTVHDIPELLSRLTQEIDAAVTLTSVDLDLPFQPGWHKRKAVQLYSTGVPALDEFMGGGWRSGECLLFMSPYGGCKTATACHAVAETALRAYKEYRSGETRKDKNGKPMIPTVVLVFTEGDRKEYQDRILSHVARVPWNRIMQMEDVLEESSKSKVPGKSETTAYEKTEFAADLMNNQKFLSERKRIRRAVRILNQHLILIDCTDSEDSPHSVGTGGIPEIANILKRHFSKHPNKYPLATWVDHISALADRMAETGGMDFDKMLHLTLKRMPRQAVDYIGKRLKCPVALMHQFSGEANKRTSATAEFHHADAAGSKSVGEFVTFAVTSTKPNEHQICTWRCTKHRREKEKPYRLIYVDGAFNRVTVDQLHVIDPSTRKIVSVADKEAKEAYKKAKYGLVTKKTVDDNGLSEFDSAH